MRRWTMDNVVVLNVFTVLIFNFKNNSGCFPERSCSHRGCLFVIVVYEFIIYYVITKFYTLHKPFSQTKFLNI